MAIGARKCLLLISTTLQVPSRVLMEVNDSAWTIPECLEHFFVAVSKRTGLVDKSLPVEIRTEHLTVHINPH
jgi:hypothetical protein